MAMFATELPVLNNYVEICVRFEIEWHTLTKIVNHDLIWPIMHIKYDQ